MPTFSLGSKTVATQAGAAQPVLASNVNLGSATFPAGHVIRHSYYTIGEGILTNLSFPADDTPPQITEGTELWSQAYTPTAAATDLYIRANVKLGETSSLTNAMALGLFLSSQNDVLVIAQGNEESDAGGGLYVVNYLHAFIDFKIASWGATERTFSLRSSYAQAYNYYEDYSAYSVGNKYSNKITSSVIITEVT